MLSDFPTVSSHFLQNQTNKPQRRKEKSKIGTPIFTMWKHREWWVWGPWQLALTNHVSHLFLLCRDYKNRETTRWRHVVIVTWVPLANLRFGYNPLRNRCGTLLLPLCDKVFWTSVFFFMSDYLNALRTLQKAVDFVRERVKMFGTLCGMMKLLKWTDVLNFYGTAQRRGLCDWFWFGPTTSIIIIFIFLIIFAIFIYDFQFSNGQKF